MTTTKHDEGKRRSARTLIQGAVVTAVIAVAAVVSNAVAGWDSDDVLSAASWITLGSAACTTVLTAVASYVAAHLAPPK